MTKAGEIACDLTPEGNAAGAASHTGDGDAGLPGQRTCIVVLGMHRSGTSALTRVLSMLGAALPRNLLGASPSNAAGHWEPENLVVYHDALLAGLQSAWHDWAALDVSQLTAQRLNATRRRIAEIIDDDYGSAPLMVVKDPRICRFAPLFLEVLTQAGITPACVLTFRNPLEVAQSLEHRDGLSRGDAGLLWLRHVLDAEYATRGKPRAVLSYDGLLADWRSEIRRISLGPGPDAGTNATPGVAMDADAGPGCAWPHPAEEVSEQIDRFLSGEHRHHTRSAADLMDDPFMSGWITDVYDALHQLRQHPPPAAALATLDRVRAEFDKAAPLFSRIQRDLRARLEAEYAERLAQMEAEQASRLGQVQAEPANLLSQAERRVTTEAAALTPGPVIARDAAETTVARLTAGRGSKRETAAGRWAGQPPDVTLWLEELPRRLSSAASDHWQCLMAPLRRARAALQKLTRSGRTG